MKSAAIMKNLLFAAAASAAVALSYSCSEDDGAPTPGGPDPEAEIVTIDFESVDLGAGASRADLAYTAEGAAFSNTADPENQYWDGFAYSCAGNDVQTDIASGQFEVYHGGGAVTAGAGHDSDRFAVVYAATLYGNHPTVTFDEPVRVASFFVNNTACAVTSMSNGDAFTKKFAAGDWFKLTVGGYDAPEAETPVYTKEFYLADYRDADPANWTMIRTWTLCGFFDEPTAVRKLVFDLSSSDNGAWGMNTPAYFALDDLRFEKAE